MNACEICLEHRNKQKQEPVIPHDIPDTPWTKIAMDIFHIGGKLYLALVDCTINFFNISQLSNKLSSTVVVHAKHRFSKYGIPKVIISDNGPEFTASTFKNFSKQRDFKHVTSSPHYHKGNRQTKRTIQTIKKSIKKALKGNDDPYLALLVVRTSPGPENNTPSVTLFYNRTIRTLILSMKTEFNQENKKLTLPNSTQHQKTLTPLKVNDLVRLHDGKTWTITGKIIKKIDDIPSS